MKEKKTENIMVNLEPSLMDIVQKVLTKNNISASSYCRSLILRDLTESGLLPMDVLLKVS